MIWLEQIGGVQNCTANKPFELKVSLVEPGTLPPEKNTTCFSSYDDFFSVFFFFCASQFYDAFSFYHKAY
jgi:hypothetical protein